MRILLYNLHFNEVSVFQICNKMIDVAPKAVYIVEGSPDIPIEFEWIGLDWGHEEKSLFYSGDEQTFRALLKKTFKEIVQSSQPQ